MTEEIARQILSNINLNTIDDITHGFVVMLDDKIWKSNSGTFIFDTVREANQAFYNGERWRFTNRYSSILYGNNMYGWPNSYDRSTRPWTEFKRLANYRIVAI